MDIYSTELVVTDTPHNKRIHPDWRRIRATDDARRYIQMVNDV